MAPTYGMDPMMTYMMGRDSDKDDNFMNNPFFYLIFIWLFAGFGGGGFGGFGGGGVSNAYEGITNDFMFNYLNNDINAIQSAISSQNAGISSGLCSLGYDMATQFGQVKYDSAMQQNALQAQMAECCCATNRNIDSVKYENQAQTTAILQAICEDGRATRDLINANTVQGLRDELQAAQLALNNAAQTQTLQAQLDAIYSKIPVPPTPAYVVPYPCCQA